jgi:acetyltransferase-like isoleucine patch superfamily enzyme
MKQFIKYILVKILSLYIRLRKYTDILYGTVHLNTIQKRGKNCFFEGDGKIYNPDSIILGDEVSIGRNFFLRGRGEINIGSYTHISRNVVIHTVNHNINGEFLPYDRNDIIKDITIGKYVWIGMNVQILQGVTIGDGAVIGTGTTVTKDVMPGEIVVGSGQRVVGKRNGQHTKNLIKKNKYLRV